MVNILSDAGPMYSRLGKGLKSNGARYLAGCGPRLCVLVTLAVLNTIGRRANISATVVWYLRCGGVDASPD